MASKGFKILNDLRYATTKLVVHTTTGTGNVGTGFFYELEIEEGVSCLLLVTNKHMVKDWKTISFKINKADEQREPILGDAVQITLDNTPTQKWIEHPDVDLCVFAIGHLIKSIYDSGIELCFRTFFKGHIPNDETIKGISSIEEILMIGYPDAMADEKHNLPIVRRGITATDFKIDYNGNKEFLIDASIFKGSSGSPIVICDIGSFINADGQLCLGDRIFFLGVQYRGEFSKFQDNIYVKNKKGDYENNPDILSTYFDDLGFCVKSECLLYFKDEIKRQGWK